MILGHNAFKRCVRQLDRISGAAVRVIVSNVARMNSGDSMYRCGRISIVIRICFQLLVACAMLCA